MPANIGLRAFSEIESISGHSPIEGVCRGRKRKSSHDLISKKTAIGSNAGTVGRDCSRRYKLDSGPLAINLDASDMCRDRHAP